MKTKQGIIGGMVGVLLSCVLALPQAMAGSVMIVNNSASTLRVITQAGTASHSLDVASKDHNTENTYLGSSITKIVAKLKTSANNWEDKGEYDVPAPAIMTNFAVSADASGSVQIIKRMELE